MTLTTSPLLLCISPAGSLGRPGLCFLGLGWAGLGLPGSRRVGSALFDPCQPIGGLTPILIRAPIASSSILLTYSEGSDTYAARQNRIRARAAKADRRVAKAARELIMPTPFVRGTEGCAEAWRTLEKCWGAEIVDKAKAEVGLTVEGREGAGNRASEGSLPTQPSPSSHAPN